VDGAVVKRLLLQHCDDLGKLGIDSADVRLIGRQPAT
jgi:hypothetical protein